MKWMRWASGALIIVVLSAATLHQQTPATFVNLHELKQRFVAAGYCCTTDRQDDLLDNGFLITRESITWAEVCSFGKAGIMGPKWKGKVWVTVNPDAWQIASIPDEADSRAWGKIVAFGDHELMTELDGVLR